MIPDPRSRFRRAFAACLSDEDLAHPVRLLPELLAALLEAALDAEMDRHLGYPRFQKPAHVQNCRNGFSKKTVHTSLGDLTIRIPRDRNASFSSRILPKYQSVLSRDMETTLFSLYAKGLSLRSISRHLAACAHVKRSPSSLSRSVTALAPAVDAWLNRPLRSFYPLLFLDAIAFPVRTGTAVSSRPLYLALAFDAQGCRHLLGAFLGNAESLRDWTAFLTSLKHRGLSDILLACVDGLAAFPAALARVFPKTRVQLCCLHLLRASTRGVAPALRPALFADLKTVYLAPSPVAAKCALARVRQTWHHTCPSLVPAWRRHWPFLQEALAFPRPLRTLVYTTNPIEALNRHLRRRLQTAAPFPSPHSLLTRVVLALWDLPAPWRRPHPHWHAIRPLLAAAFPSRFPP